jgi:pyruvate formate lyase activating enzyme
MKILQKGFNYSQDGPGNRLVYHIQGCNFRCKWCSNADSIPLENSECREVSVNVIADEIFRSKMMFFDGGGVTFTGGEATLPADELIELLKAVKKEDINTCIETNGSSPRLPEISEYVDYLIMDFKIPDETKHIKWCGVSNRAVKTNAEFFLSSGREIHFRIPLIHGVNDSDCDEFTEYFKQYDTSKADFEFLPYHEFGKDKWKGRYEIADGFVPAETLRLFIKTFTENGLKVIST